MIASFYCLFVGRKISQISNCLVSHISPRCWLWLSTQMLLIALFVIMPLHETNFFYTCLKLIAIFFRFYRQFILFAFYFSISMVCFVLRPGPPPTGLKPPLINYTSTTTTVATTPLDFMDNESMLPDNVMYDEMIMMGGGGLADLDPAPTVSEIVETPSKNRTNTNNGTGTLLTYEGSGVNDDSGDTVNLYGKNSGSDRGRHKTTWTQPNRTIKTNYTFNYNKVRLTV